MECKEGVAKKRESRQWSTHMVGELMDTLLSSEDSDMVWRRGLLAAGEGRRETFTQSLAQTPTESTTQSGSQSSSQPVNQSVIQSSKQPVIQSAFQSSTQSVNSIRQATLQPVTH